MLVKSNAMRFLLILELGDGAGKDTLMSPEHGACT